MPTKLSSSSDNSPKKLLAECGFEPQAQLILSYLLENGPAPARVLSQSSGLKRPTVYAALDRLIQGGYVSKRKAKGATYFYPISREHFADLVRLHAAEHFEKVESASNQLKILLQALGTKPSQQFGGLVVESLESELGLYKEMYENLLSGDYLGIFNPQYAVNRTSRPLLTKFFERTQKTRPLIREIAVAGPMCDWYKEQIKNPRHEVRTLPKTSSYITDMILAENSVILLDYSPKSRAAVRIRHSNLYHSFVSIFEELWKRIGI